MTHQLYTQCSLRELFDMVNEIKALIDKEIRLELRQKYAINGMLLYIVSTVYVCYLSFRLKTNHIDKITWNTLFWIIILFTAVNAIAKSFTQERYGRLLYYYTLANPVGIIVSKIIYNSILMLVLSLVGFGVYGLVMGNLIECPKHNGQFDYRTGEAKRAPACVNLKTFPVRVQDGQVYIEI